MPEILEGATAEIQPIPEILVSYELSEQTKPLFKINGKLLGKALQESGYKTSILCPITITDFGMPESLAYYDPARGRVIVNQNTVIEQVRKVREEELAYLKGIKTNKLKRILQMAKGYVNPISLPYMTLPDYGSVHHFSGSSQRRDRYLQAAQKGFPDNQGEARYSREDALSRSKQFIDGLIEKATPGVIGWVIAHEFEHRNEAKRKIGVGLGLLLTPLLAGTATISGPPSESGGFMAGIFGAYLGYVIGRRMNEKASYDAADRNVQRFAKAITVDSALFKQKVLGK